MLFRSAAVVMGFIVAKVWQRDRPVPFAKVELREAIPLNKSGPRQPTNAGASVALSPPVLNLTPALTNTAIVVLRTNGFVGPLVVNYQTSAVAVLDSYTTNLMLNQGVVVAGDFTSFNTTPQNRVARLIQDGTVSVDFRTGDGTAVAGVDYIAQNGTLTFGNGRFSKQIGRAHV